MLLLQTLRKHRGLSRADVADAVGLSRVSIANLENRTCEPKLKTAERLSRYFSVPASDLFESADDARLLVGTRAYQ